LLFKIAMNSALLFLFIPILGVFQLAPEIISPRSGDVIQGTQRIIGTSEITGFLSSEVSFAYLDDPTNTWFLISRSDQSVQNGTLGEWNSTDVTDGEYSLRLRITLDDLSEIDVTVAGLRVRNYTPIETPTSNPSIPTEEKPALVILAPTSAPTYTPLAPNPAQMRSESILSSMGYGAIVVVVLLLVLGMYLRFRR
jgi:hypothetical protein